MKMAAQIRSLVKIDYGSETKEKSLTWYSLQSAGESKNGQDRLLEAKVLRADSHSSEC
jgi:hypothetical protein